ncbi:methyltransferase domain-containing protein [Pseudobutyrivibrio xylanivorans]|uniref:Methyltransferase domain-containing protein n=1 Tax=Pseudobutyrivibrio xylanivorans TaxID=185007 RepID=A0A5P6VUS0_PSEXY|nr:methyltransferase domain-containing protein [Pseudobutyrivibrio xylanivorans]QFJ54994.1 methyltransferase domain-containing protein [Pseudobutyrivibrio xylanivorans]
MGYVLFGAGVCGQEAIKFLGKENIECFLDNNPSCNDIEGIPVYRFDDAKNNYYGRQIVISVKEKYFDVIKDQLLNNGFDYTSYEKLRFEIIREKLLNRPDYISIYKKTINWIKNNSIFNQGIRVTSDCLVSYPEVTGYYIPTLLRWGYRELAISYANWLISIQKEDGSWYDAYDKNPYIFDTAQILKGLIAIREIIPSVDRNIIRGCEWILSCMTNEGRLVTPSKEAWGDDKNICDEVIHIYCISPIIEAGRVLNRPEFIEKANEIWGFYRKNYYDKIMNFSLLSHFYAYLMEALFDIGEIDMCEQAMNSISKFQKESGAIPALNNVDWVCSTGVFQLALVWFKLGKIENGDKAFEYACKLQNESGGWFGSYLSENNLDEKNSYFPSREISWACKYFLDALYYKNFAEFNMDSDTFIDEISKNDDRYKNVLEAVKSIGKGKAKVLDIGCGKGRYLKRIIEDLPLNNYYAVDISPYVMKYINDERIECKQGTLTNIQFPDDYFDCVYTCEALEHSIDIDSAIREMSRVTRAGGLIVVVDKNKKKLGQLDIGEWEQWFDINELRSIMEKYCSEVKVNNDISYENKKADGLFVAWIGTVK